MQVWTQVWGWRLRPRHLRQTYWQAWTLLLLLLVLLRLLLLLVLLLLVLLLLLLLLVLLLRKRRWCHCIQQVKVWHPHGCGSHGNWCSRGFKG